MKTKKHLTKNASESFNNYLKKIFSKNSSFNKLIYTLKKEKSLSYNDYERRIGGIWKKKGEYWGKPIMFSLFKYSYYFLYYYLFKY